MPKGNKLKGENVMDKITYYVVTVARGEKKYSFAFYFRNNENLFSGVSALLSEYGNIETLNACDSRKKAVECANTWNESWERKGILMDDPVVLWRVVYN